MCGKSGVVAVGGVSGCEWSSDVMLVVTGGGVVQGCVMACGGVYG